MSRTVHHVPYKHRESTRAALGHDERLAGSGGPFSRYRIFRLEELHEVRALRYSAAVEADAAAEGRRPRPEARRHRLEAYVYPRTHGVRAIGRVANRRERAVRSAARDVGASALQRLRAALDVVDAAWDVEFPDPRHRGFAVWDSW